MSRLLFERVNSKLVNFLSKPAPTLISMTLPAKGMRLSPLSLNKLYIHAQCRTAFDWAWDTILEASQNETTVKTLRQLFPDTDNRLEERQFTRLHQIVLGLNGRDLEAELIDSQTNINAVDSRGKTALMVGHFLRVVSFPS